MQGLSRRSLDTHREKGGRCTRYMSIVCQLRQKNRGHVALSVLSRQATRNLCCNLIPESIPRQKESLTIPPSSFLRVGILSGIRVRLQQEYSQFSKKEGMVNIQWYHIRNCLFQQIVLVPAPHVRYIECNRSN